MWIRARNCKGEVGPTKGPVARTVSRGLKLSLRLSLGVQTSNMPLISCQIVDHPDSVAFQYTYLTCVYLCTRPREPFLRSIW